jgi:hypothetical protein
MGRHGLLYGELYFLYVDDIRTSQETYVWGVTVCYTDSFTFSHITDDVQPTTIALPSN